MNTNIICLKNRLVRCLLLILVSKVLNLFIKLKHASTASANLGGQSAVYCTGISI